MTLAVLAAYAMVTAALFVASNARAKETLELIPCNAAVYLNDTDPKGTNLRAGPGSRHKVVSVIKDTESRLEITGSVGNWLRVRKVTEGYGGVLFSGEGWIFGPLTSVRSRGKALLFQSASEISDSVGQMPDQEEASVQSCSGGWVKVKYKVEGWLAFP